MTKILKKIGSVLAAAVVVIELIAIVFIVVMRLSGGVPSVMGYNFFVIVSPSMEPEICVGDIIISKEYDGGEIKVDQVVTYLGREGDFAGKMVTHKVIAVSEDGETITTKGVANNGPDPDITKNDIKSVMVHKTFLIGKIYSVISSTWGFILFVLLPMCALIVSEIVNLAREIQEDRKEIIDDESEESEK